MKRWIALLLTLLLALPVAALAAEKGLPLQEVHKVSLTKTDTTQSNKSVIRLWHAETALPAVDEEVNGLAEAFAADLAKQDALGNTVDVRVNMYNPMYYLCAAYEGYQTADPAVYWRIRTGITQGDTALCTEIDLALAAEAYAERTQVDFETVWGQGHTMAERTGSSTENYIAWVHECMK